MTENTYPMDALGNPLKKGSLVQVEIPQGGHVLWRVQETSPSRKAGEGNGVLIPGTVTLVASITLAFDPNNPIIQNCLCLREPESSMIVVPDGKVRLSQ